MLKFQDLYESYATEVYRFSVWLSGDHFEAEDITSETFIRAWARSSTIRTETLKAYLFTIARNVYLEERRKRKRQVALKDVYPDPAPGPEPERSNTAGNVPSEKGNVMVPASLMSASVLLKITSST
ncbi:unnamed protein product [marine sediment metagenome]|uniref:RNA polymerase sigma-70 region 2 domain-containing protein n=1 Tax=marine sediment metagenome TaxID=412755 RepID=X0ZLJ0_9ZZZZ